MLGIIAVPGVLFLFGSMLLPDSLRWLIMLGRWNDAISALQRLRGDSQTVAPEAADIQEQLQTPQHGWHLLLENANFRRSVGLAVMLQLVQQFTGMNALMYYAPRIFQDMGYDTASQMWFTAAVGLTNVLATIIGIGLIDRWERKPNLCSGFSVMALGLGVVGTMIDLGITTHTEQIFTVAMLLTFIVGFALPAGPLVWTLCPEVQPLKGRDFGIGRSTFTNWIANMVVGATFLSLLNCIGNAATFWLYVGLNLLFLLFTDALVPETKGITLEDMERNLMHGKRLRDIGQQRA